MPATAPSTSTPGKSRHQPSLYRWTYDEYQRLVDAGFDFDGRVELVGGKIIKMAAHKDLHAASYELTRRAVESAFGPGFWVRGQLPLHLGRWSGPEPDVAVVPGGPRDYVGTGHPRSALLVVEIGDATSLMDRRIKGPRYARAGYADYWIVNLVDRVVEIHRDPVADASVRLGWRYSQVTVLTPPAALAPLAAPNAPIAMADLLP